MSNKRTTKQTNPVTVLPSDSFLDLSGAWFDPKNPGWGIIITNHGEDTHSVAIYTYDTSGNQCWFVGATDRSTLSFSLNSPTGAGPFNTLGNQVDRAAGILSLDVVSPGTISFIATIRTAITHPEGDFSPSPEYQQFKGTLAKL